MRIQKRESRVGDIKATAYGYFFVSILTTLFALFSRDFLPPNYSFDGNSIQAIAQGTTFVAPDASYQVAGDFFRLLGLADAPSIVSILGPLMISISLWVIAKHELQSGEFEVWAVAIVGQGLAAVYLSWYSKDLITLIFILAFIVASRSSSVFSILILLTYSLVFRQYWLIAMTIFIFQLRVSRTIRRDLRYWLITASAFLAIAVVAAPLVTQSDIMSLRQNLNQYRLDSGVNSLIGSFVDSSQPFWGYVNILITLFTLVLPVPLMLGGNVIHIASALAVSLLWLIYLRANRSLNLMAQMSWTKLDVSLFPWSLLIVLSLFEPDYGSYVRHITPLIPLIMLVVVYALRESTNRYPKGTILGHGR